MTKTHNHSFFANIAKSSTVTDASLLVGGAGPQSVISVKFMQKAT
jgi:hypothetical protein